MLCLPSLNAAKIPGLSTKDKTQVIAVAAMEAVGLSEAMERWAKTSGSAPIPYVSVRGMSNQLHHPVAQDTAGRLPGRTCVDMVLLVSTCNATENTWLLTDC